MELFNFLREFKLPFTLLFELMLVFWVLPAFFVDGFRQKMFALRDSLFSEAAEGLIDFDHPAYGMLRSTMNGYIRFAHRLTLTHALFLMWRLRGLLPEEPSFETKWEGHVAQLDSRAQERLRSYKERMDRALVRHVLYSSPLLLILIVPWIIVWVLVHYCVSGLTSFFRGTVDSLDWTALAVGESAA